MGILHNDNGYAVRLKVPLQTVASASGTASALTNVFRSGQGYNILQTASTANTSVAWAFSWDLPPIPYQIGNTGNNVARGFQLTDVTVVYGVSSAVGTATANASTMNFTAWLSPASGYTDAASAPSSGMSVYGGTSSQWTFNEGSSTGINLSSLPVASASTLYVVTLVPGSGLNPYINTDMQKLVFDWTFNGPVGSTTTFQFTVHDIEIHGKYLLT